MISPSSTNGFQAKSLPFWCCPRGEGELLQPSLLGRLRHHLPRTIPAASGSIAGCWRPAPPDVAAEGLSAGDGW